MSSSKNPWNQLLASNRRRSKGSLDKLQLRLWHGICAAEAGLHDAMEQADARRSDAGCMSCINSLAPMPRLRWMPT